VTELNDEDPPHYRASNTPPTLYGYPVAVEDFYRRGRDGGGAYEWRLAHKCAVDCNGFHAADCCPRPVSDPSETLALMAEHRLYLAPSMDGGWLANGVPNFGQQPQRFHGPTIGDAVRACVARIKER
jgi:hypothetical protein